MQTVTGAQQETETFVRLSTKLAACMPQGTQLTFSKAVLMGVLAESIYRLSVAAQRRTESKR